MENKTCPVEKQDPLRTVKSAFMGGMTIAAFILPIVMVFAVFRRGN